MRIIIILNGAQKQKDNASQRSNRIIITIPGYLLRNSLQLPANLLLGAPTNISAKAIKAYSGALHPGRNCTISIYQLPLL